MFIFITFQFYTFKLKLFPIQRGFHVFLKSVNVQFEKLRYTPPLITKQTSDKRYNFLSNWKSKVAFSSDI